MNPELQELLQFLDKAVTFEGPSGDRGISGDSRRRINQLAQSVQTKLDRLGKLEEEYDFEASE